MKLEDFNPIVTCYGGSHAYGTNIATSDIDIRGNVSFLLIVLFSKSKAFSLSFVNIYNSINFIKLSLSLIFFSIWFI